jgi:hypothetical protein
VGAGVIIDETLVGVWYVAFDTPHEVLVMLERHADHYTIIHKLGQVSEGGKSHVVRSNKTLVPLSAAIARVRSHVEDLHKIDSLKVKGSWEVLRGGRTVEEFTVLLASMPYRDLAAATPAEVESLNKIMRTSVPYP